MGEVTKVTGVAQYVDVSDKTFGRNNNHRHSIKVDGTQYSCFLAQTKPLAEQGAEVQFDAEKNKNGYWDLKPESVKTLKKATAATRAKSSKGNVGMAVGHAINNAVAIAVANGQPTSDTVKAIAIKIYQLSLEMQEEATQGLYDLEAEDQPEESEPQEAPSDDFDDDDIPF